MKYAICIDGHVKSYHDTLTSLLDVLEALDRRDSFGLDEIDKYYIKSFNTERRDGYVLKDKTDVLLVTQSFKEVMHVMSNLLMLENSKYKTANDFQIENIPIKKYDKPKASYPRLARSD